MDTIYTHTAKRQRISRRALVAVVWVRRMDDPFLAQDTLHVRTSIKGTQIKCEVSGIHDASCQRTDQHSTVGRNGAHKSHRPSSPLQRVASCRPCGHTAAR